MEPLLTQHERLNSASSSVCALEEDREKTNSLISYSAHSLEVAARSLLCGEEQEWVTEDFFKE